MVPAKDIEPGDVVYNFERPEKAPWVHVLRVSYSQQLIHILTDAAVVRLEHPERRIVVRRES